MSAAPYIQPPAVEASSTKSSRLALVEQSLPPGVAAALWRANELGTAVNPVLSTGFDALDVELPGGGWPCHALTELLQPQPSIVEWRLLGPAMRRVVANGQNVVVVGPSLRPHLAGLQHLGVDEKHLVWIQAETPSERLWVTEQLVKANAAGLVVSWLPQARQDQIRRLQVCAQGCDGPVILCRPAAAEHEASAAPLRIQVTYGVDWELRLHILKRRGATHEGSIVLSSIPGGLEAVITPRLLTPSLLIAHRKDSELRTPQAANHVVGSTSSPSVATRRVEAH